MILKNSEKLRNNLHPQKFAKKVICRDFCKRIQPQKLSSLKSWIVISDKPLNLCSLQYGLINVLYKEKKLQAKERFLN